MLKKFLKKILLNHRLKKLSRHGKNVWIGPDSRLYGRIIVGSHVSIGSEALFISTRATINIHDYVMIGPKVSIYTGDHRTDVIGKHICEVTDADKDLEPQRWDRDVIIKAGVWIGTGAILLKGVTIGQGAVIGAGAIVTKDVPPYHIYVGTPQNFVLKPRFTEEQIFKHEQILKERGITVE